MGMFAQEWKKLNTSKLQSITFSSKNSSDVTLLKDIKEILFNAINCIYGNAQTDDKYIKIVDLIMLRITAIIKDTKISVADSYNVITNTLEQFFNNLDSNITTYDNVVLDVKKNILDLTNNITNDLQKVKKEDTNNKESSEEKTTKKEDKKLSIAQQLQDINNKIVCLNKNTNIVQFIRAFFDKNFSPKNRSSFYKKNYKPVQITKNVLKQIKLNVLFILELNNQYTSFVKNYLDDSILTKIQKIEITAAKIYERAKEVFKRKTLIDYIIDFIKNSIINNLKKRLFKSATNKNSLGSFFGQLLQTLTSPLTSIKNFLLNDVVKPFTDKFTGLKSSPYSRLRKKVRVLRLIKRMLQTVLNVAIKTVKALFVTAKFLVTTIWNVLKFTFNIAKQFIAGLANLISAGFTAARTWLSNTAVGRRIANIYNSVKGFLIKRASQLRTFFGRAFSKPIQFFKNLSRPFQNLGRNIGRYASKLSRGVSRCFTRIGQSITGAFKSAGKTIAKQISKFGRKIVTAITKKIGPIVVKMFAKTAGKSAGKSLGRTIIKKIINFIVKKVLKRISAKMLQSLVMCLFTGPVGVVINCIMWAWTIYDMFRDDLAPMLDNIVNVVKYCSINDLKNMVFDFVMEQLEKLKNIVGNILEKGKEWFNKYVIGFIKAYVHMYVAIFNFFTGTKRVNTSKYEKEVNDTINTKNVAFLSLGAADKLSLLNKFNMDEITQFIKEIDRLTKQISTEEDKWFPSTKLINKLIDLRQKNFLSLAEILGKYGITNLDKNTLDNLPSIINDLKQKIWDINYKPEVESLEQSLKNKLNDLHELSKEFDNLKKESNNQKFKLMVKDLKRYIYSEYMQSCMNLLAI